MVCQLPLVCDFTCVVFAVPLPTEFVIVKTMAKIYVNGDVQEVSLPLTVTELVKNLLVENPEMVSVQVNEEFAERDDWDSIQVQEDDKVDFLYFMGGGIC